MTTRRLNSLTIAEARDALRAREITAVELAQSCLQAVDEADALGAFVCKTAEIALDQARAADQRLAAGDAPDLCGIPLGIKDIFCTRDVPTEAGSRILAGFRPAYESTVTEKLSGNGAVMLGKLNLDEFAMGSTNERSSRGPAVNPWRRKDRDDRLTPGGSSGGSAAAVAADLCLGALGSDTAGSIRLPAAFTGTVGLKPTYGRVSRWGMIAVASSLDHAGPMTRNTRDAAILLQGMAGHDEKDATSADLAVPDFEAALTGDIRGKIIGIPGEYRLDQLDGEIAALWERGAALLQEAGAEIREISLPHTQYALPAYHVIAPAEASSNLARFDGVRYGYRAALAKDDGITDLYEKSRAEGFGHEVQRRLIFGTAMLTLEFHADYFERARKIRTLVKRDFDQAFAAGIDAILTPTTLSAAFSIDDPAPRDPIAAYLSDTFTVPANLAGLPAVALPIGLNEAGLPLSLQLIGRSWQEADLLNHAHVLEQASGFVDKPARWW